MKPKPRSRAATKIPRPKNNDELGTLRMASNLSASNLSNYMSNEERRIRLAYAQLYDLLSRFSSPDMCPTADEIAKTIATLDKPVDTADLILALLPTVQSRISLLHIERTAMQHYHALEVKGDHEDPWLVSR